MRNLEVIIKRISEFEKIIEYTFEKKESILLALTHSSYANENKHMNLSSNERIEFLGDSVLNIIISENIYLNYPELPEGEMTKVRASIVCETTLSKCAKKLKLGQLLFMGKGEELTGGRDRISILSDAYEALIGAIYLDGGYNKARDFVYSQMNSIIRDSVKGNLLLDYKTELQEIVQKNNDNLISYEIVNEKGPDHNKIFLSHVKLGDNVVGRGEGKTKKEAEQNAAKAALNNISNN